MPGALNFSSNSHQELDRWIILTERIEEGRSWVGTYFHVFANQRFDQSGWVVVAPIYDLTDQLMIKIVTGREQLVGQLYYEYIDIRRQLTNIYAGSGELNTHALAQYRRIRDNKKTFISPRHEPEGECDDWSNLRGRWVSPDPIIYQDCNDLSVIQDVPGWLAPKKRICDGCRSGLGTWCRKAQRELVARQMDDVSALARLQQRSIER